MFIWHLTSHYHTHYRYAFYEFQRMLEFILLNSWFRTMKWEVSNAFCLTTYFTLARSWALRY